MWKQAIFMCGIESASVPHPHHRSFRPCFSVSRRNSTNFCLLQKTDAFNVRANVVQVNETSAMLRRERTTTNNSDDPNPAEGANYGAAHARLRCGRRPPQ